MANILLVEITVYDPTIPGETVVRVCTGGGYRHPTAPGPYRDAILELSKLRREIFADGQAFGAGSDSYGPLRLANLNGWLDWLVENDCAVDGRSLVMRVGDGAAAYNTFVTVFAGSMDQMLVGNDYVELRIRDTAGILLDAPIQQARYAGDNVLPAGTEGVEDVKDQWKPWLDGYGFNVSPPCVNTSKLIYQVSDDTADDIAAVRFSGSAQTKGTARADLATLEATAPTAGQYDYYLGSGGDGSFYKLGSSPGNGDVTADAIKGATAADRTPAQNIKRALLRAGVAAGDITAADVTALDSAAGYDSGLWIGTGETTVREVIDRSARSAAAGVWRDALGKWRMVQIAAPAGTPVAEFKRAAPGTKLKVAAEADIISLEPLFTGRADAGVPPHTVAVKYAYNHTVQDRAGLVGIALPDQQRYTADYYERKYETAAVLTKHPSSTPLTVETVIRLEADALDLATHLQTLFGVTRRRYAMRVQMTPALAGAVDLGEVVKVTWHRFGLDAGKLFLVTAIEIDPLTLSADLIIWG